jgi:hypothetical protein
MQAAVTARRRTLGAVEDCSPSSTRPRVKTIDDPAGRAVRFLVGVYLPALDALAAAAGPGLLRDVATELSGRLERGMSYDGPGVERWFELLAEYELVCDAANMTHAGTAMHPATYLHERIERVCHPR